MEDSNRESARPASALLEPTLLLMALVLVLSVAGALWTVLG